MRIAQRIAPLVMAGMMSAGAFVGVSALTATSAQAVTCTDPGPATNFKDANGNVDIAAYLAAVGAFNACLSGSGASTGGAGGTAGGGTSNPVARTLAFTGSDSKSLGALGVAMAGLGIGGIAIGRRRRHADATVGRGIGS